MENLFIKSVYPWKIYPQNSLFQILVYRHLSFKKFSYRKVGKVFGTIGQLFKFHVGQIERSVANDLTSFTSFLLYVSSNGAVLLRCIDAEMGPSNLLLAPAYIN